MLLYVQTVFLRYINILYRSHFPARSEENSETLPDLTSYPSKKRQPSPASFYRDVQSFHVKYYHWKAERSGTYDCRSPGVRITLITLIFSLFILHSGRNPPAKCSIALGLPMPRITWGAQSWRCVRLGAQRIQSMADNLNFQKLKSKSGVEHYNYNTSCGNNNVWHNDSDHASLPSRVQKMEGANLLLALFIRLWFLSNIYHDSLY